MNTPYNWVCPQESIWQNELNLSVHYVGDKLKLLTGKSAQHIYTETD